MAGELGLSAGCTMHWNYVAGIPVEQRTYAFCSTLQFFSQFGIVILLLGTLAGGVSQIGEAFSYGLLLVCTPPEWLTNGTGR
jgi:hypothetical protein